MKYLSIIIILFLISCSQDEALSNNLSSHKSITNEDLGLAIEFYRELDKNFPGPEFPGFNNQKKVVKVNRYGLIELEGGQLLKMAGLDCDHNDLAEYLNAFLVKDQYTKIVFIPSGFELDNKIFAYIWEVETLKDSVNPTSTSPLSDTVINSKWCKPMNHDQHKFHERFLKIYEFN